MFSGYQISKIDSFEKHLNKYNVIHINMAEFASTGKNISEMLDYLCKRIIYELKREFGDVDCFNWNDVISVLNDVFVQKKIPFIVCNMGLKPSPSGETFRLTCL